MIIPLERVRSFGIALLLTALLRLCMCAGVWAQAHNGTISWGEALDQDSGWYASAEAVRIADNVLLFQHENGGWPKNTDMAGVLTEADKARVREEQAGRHTTLSNTTIDNGATYTQMRYLARVYEAVRYDRFQEGFLRGLDYLLEAQYENGGWPQYYPIRKGYYEHVTFNDGAMIEVMRLLRDIVQHRPPFSFVDAAHRKRARKAIEKGLGVILRTQVVDDGRLTAWCAQYDQNDLSCAKARAYELPSLSGAESVGIVRYLMEIEQPNPEAIRAVVSAIEWLERVKLTGIAVEDREDPSLPRGYDRVVVSDALAEPLWARFHEIGTNRPIFVGRDGIVRYALAEIEHERRIGYRWLGDWARDLLEKDYPVWRGKWVAE